MQFLIIYEAEAQAKESETNIESTIIYGFLVLIVVAGLYNLSYQYRNKSLIPAALFYFLSQASYFVSH